MRLRAGLGNAALLVVGLALGVTAGGAETPIPPAPTRWATDKAGFMSPQALQQVDGTLEGFDRATGNQVLVWIGDTTGDAPLEDWTVKAFERWKVGRKGLDDGLILFVFAKDRKARIEVGYGLEGKVPDAIASRILNEVILPKIQGGDRDGAILAGVNSLLNTISGGESGAKEGGAQAGRTGDTSRGSSRGSAKGRAMSLPQKVLVGILILGFLILLVTHPSLALYLLFSILSGGRGGGGGGGGFSGGGGGSGGGGASGSW